MAALTSLFCSMHKSWAFFQRETFLLKKWSCGFATLNGDAVAIDSALRQRWQFLQGIKQTERAVDMKRKSLVDTSTSTAANQMYLKIMHTGPGELPSVALELQRGHHMQAYYFNFAGGHIRRQMTNHEFRLKPVHSMLLMDLHWENLVSGVTRLLQTVMPPVSGICDMPIFVYGPPGTTKNMNAMLSMMLSRIKFRHLWANLIITEIPGSSCSVSDGAINFRMINLHPPSSFPVSSYLFSVSCSDIEPDFDRYSKDGADDLMQEPLTHEAARFSGVLEENTENKIKSVLESHPLVNVAVVSCPTVKHKNMLIKSLDFSDDVKQKIMVHFTPDDIYHSYEYQKWTEKFGAECKHIVLNLATKPKPAMFKSDFNRLTLHEIQPSLFPIYEKDLSLEDFKDAFGSEGKLHVAPHKYRLSGGIFEVKESLNRMEKLMNYFNTYLLKLESLKPEPPIVVKKTYPCLVVLGCGSATPTEYRATPAFLLQLSPTSSILIDCGYDTYTQMHKHFGSQKIKEVLESIKVIFISHRHTDHFGGLPIMLKMIETYWPQKKTEVLCSSLIVRYVLRCPLRYGMNFSSLKGCNFTAIEKVASYTSKMRYFANLLHIQDLIPVLVDHPYPTYGLVVQGLGWKLVYSSDTLPMSGELVRLGKNADILVHDCLFLEDRHEWHARLKRHSTLSGALDTAQAMSAKNVVLTHLRSLYPFIPTKDLDMFKRFDGNALFAHDHMEVTRDNIKLYNRAYNQMACLYEHSLHKRLSKDSKLQKREETKNLELLHSFNELLELENVSANQ